MLKVLVTGGAGFIGSNIVKGLVDKGMTPHVLDNLSSGYRENLISGVPFWNGDVRDAESVETAMQGCSAVIHLAASVGNKRSIDDPGQDASVNLLGTVAILESARKLGIKRVVFSSSAGIFGELKTLPIAEDHEQCPDSPYGVSKLAAEKLCLVYNKLYGMTNFCLRYFNVYGINQRYDAYGNVIPIFALRILTGEALTIFGDGEQTRDFVNVIDVAAVNIMAVMSETAGGVYNIGSGTRVSINELAQMMMAHAESKRPVQYGPPRPGDVRDSLADIRSARARLGYRPQMDLKKGLEKYMNWMKSDPISLERIASRK